MALSPSLMLRRGLVARCPICGQNRLFRRLVWMVEACPRCGLRFKRIPGHWLGSWFINIFVAQTVLVVILVVGVALTWPDVPLWPLAIVDLASAVIVPVLFFPIARMLWTAIDLAMRPLSFDEGVDPAYELAHIPRRSGPQLSGRPPTTPGSAPPARPRRRSRPA